MDTLEHQRIVMHATNKIMKILLIQIILLRASQLPVRIVIQRVDGRRQILITMDNTSRYTVVNTMGSGMIALIAILIRVIFLFSLVSLVMNTIKLIRIMNIRGFKVIFIKVKNVMPAIRMEKLTAHLIINSQTSL